MSVLIEIRKYIADYEIAFDAKPLSYKITPDLYHQLLEDVSIEQTKIIGEETTQISVESIDGVDIILVPFNG